MININATNFRKNLFTVIEQTIKYNEPVNISTKEGNAVLVSEDEYNNLIETIYLLSIHGMKEKIAEGLNTQLEDCIPDSEAVW